MRNYKEKVQNTSAHISNVFNSIFDTNGEFDSMTFDIVVGNPPYNRDDYLDFVRFGNKIAKRYTCMITPAKWQGKGGERNEAFRKEIVPYMSKIVYYPVATDIFNIKEWDGITYFLSVKDSLSETKEITNISKWQNKFNTSSTRQLGESLNNSFISILNKVRDSKNFNEISINYEAYFDCKDASFVDDKHHTIEVLGGDSQGNMQIDGYANIDDLKHKDDINKYKLIMHRMPGRNSTLVSDGTTYGNSEVKVIGKGAVCKDAYIVLATSDSIEELKCIMSYFNTKFVRGLTYCGCVGTSAGCKEYWRFVPDPGPFDHIFTDEELYKKYNLTDNEIDLIESVIKDRTE